MFMYGMWVVTVMDTGLTDDHPCTGSELPSHLWRRGREFHALKILESPLDWDDTGAEAARRLPIDARGIYDVRSSRSQES